MDKAKVYFTKEITPESVIKMYEKLGKELPGKVAVKLHSGEQGNQNYIRPEFVKAIVERVNGTVVECNAAYEGARNSTEKHKKLIEDHGWTKYFDVDIMDADGDDMVLDIPNGKVLKQNFVGKNMKNYDSMLVLSHFKGHPMGGYGGALKQLSIGCASSEGKSWIHSAGHTKDQTIEDIGILTSTAPIAIDQACIDLVYNSKDSGRDHFVETVERQNGTHTIDAALGYKYNC